LVIGDTVSKSLPPLPGAQNEARTVARLLSAARYHADPLIQQGPTDILRALFTNEYRIIHLAGHGIYNESDPANSGMVLGDDIYLTPLELGKLRTIPELVFINCCHLGQMDRLELSSPSRMAASVSQKLIEMGVKAVVAAGWAVDDAAAVAFAETFYRHMLSGEKFGQSVKTARNAAYGNGATNTWGAYQCYGNPDFVLTMEGPVSKREPVFCSKRECIEELRDIAAQTKGASEDLLKDLAQRAAGINQSVAPGWRDAELLSSLGDTFRELSDFESAIVAYESALAQPDAHAPIRSIEQFANVLDRRAGQLNREFATSARASEMWARAEKLITNLIDIVGPSAERYALLGALWKRRGDYQQAASNYEKAYKLTRSSRGIIDTYPGFNWLQLAYINGTTSPELNDIAEECMKEAERPKAAPTFWDRVGVADGLVTKYLTEGSLANHIEEVVAEYNSVLQHGSPREWDSVLAQLNFIQSRKGSAELQQIIDRVKATMASMA
jgi:tetratricopeptide (TPR) repeat protein